VEPDQIALGLVAHPYPILGSGCGAIPNLNIYFLKNILKNNTKI
jgi:hypothetical protein